MKNNYKMTMYACFIGYIVQAVVNSFVPLLFVTFQTEYHIPLTQITLLITVNFVIQLVVDLLSAGFVDNIGHRLLLRTLVREPVFFCLRFYRNCFQINFTAFCLPLWFMPSVAV